MKRILTLLIFFMLLTFIPINVSAKEKIKIHLFYSETCPHCKAEIKALNELDMEFELVTYEVNNEENSQKIELVKEAFGITHPYVPFTVIGTVTFTGYNENVLEKIIAALEYYEKNEYRDITTEINDGSFIVGFNKFEKDIIKDKSVSIPIIGEINPKSFSLPLLAIIIGTIDGFNPCAMWVLLFLIGMLIGMKDKKRMWILGLTFLGSSALIYALLMVSWLTISLSIMQIGYVRILIALFALAAGIYNLLKFMRNRKKEDGCEIVDEKKRKKTFEKIKHALGNHSLILAMIGISLLAVSVNIVELACSAGLPLVFTQVLAVNNLSAIEYGIYIFLYILFFLIDDIIIFAIATKTFELVGMSNKYSKLATIIGGMIMVIVGLLLIFAPNILMFS